MFNLSNLVSKLVCFGFIGFYCAGAGAMMASARIGSADKVMFIEDVNYMQEMTKCAKLGDETSLALGSIYEKQRNAKLKKHGIYEETNFFEPYKPAEEIWIDCVAYQMEEQYEYAGFVWKYLRKQGWRDETIAGVLGNMMRECGSDTLVLSPFVYEYEQGQHYGLCQWSLKYYPEIDGVNCLRPIQFLVKTVQSTMSQFGGSFDEFAKLGARDAGIYFGQYYERGGSNTKRGQNAEKAFEWIERYTK